MEPIEGWVQATVTAGGKQTLYLWPFEGWEVVKVAMQALADDMAWLTLPVRIERSQGRGISIVHLADRPTSVVLRHFP